MARIKKLFSGCLIMMLSFTSFAQDEDCEATLIRATDEFNAGHFLSIPSILNNCLVKFTREQRQRANILLTQTYLLLDDPMGAKRSYLEVLHANPEFITDENVHFIDVVYLSKKFTAAPIFSWFVNAGSNVSPIRVLVDNDAFDGSAAKEFYTLRPGYQAAVGGDLHLDEQLAIRGELNYRFTVYQHDTRNYFDKDTKNVIDRQSWLALPLTFVYSDNKGSYRPYAYAGYSAGLLLKDKANISIEKNDDNESNTDEESPAMDFTYKRNRFNQSITLGGGIKYKLGLDFLFVDVRYSIGLKNMVKEQGLYANYNYGPTTTDFLKSTESTVSYVHVDDYFRMDNLAISVGFIRPIYKPREIKKAKTRSLMKRIQKQDK